MLKEYRNGVLYTYPDTQGKPGEALGRDGNWVPLIVGANYRNSTTQIVKERVPLLIDGLLSPSFNKMSFPVWDTQTSKIYPQKIDEIYFARFNIITNAITSTVITIELEVNGNVLATVDFQPKQMQNAFDSGLMLFYTGANFVSRGGGLFISATDEVKVSKASMLLIRLAGEDA